MAKKLKLVLREPVKLYETKQESAKPVLEKETKLLKAVKPNEKSTKLLPEDNKVSTLESSPESVQKPQLKAEELSAAKVEGRNADFEKILAALPPRVRQIWDYFCAAASADGNLKNSFIVTRSEVMKKAGIGSTNTYRDALKRFQNEGLIEIELRPGVNSGSVFYLTEKGRELAGYTV